MTTVMIMALGMLLAAPAFAQPYPPGASGACDSTAIAPGSTVNCSASGFEPGSTVTFTVESGDFTFSTTATADANGTVTITFDVPEDATTGEATFSFSGQDAEGNFTRVASGTLTVDEALDTGLPSTGGEFTVGAALAAVVLVVGAGFVVMARRRSRHDVTTH